MIGWDVIVTRLLLAALFGALIGLERERKDWAAGMRTHMMVSVGSCLIMLVSAFGFADILGTEHVELDPSRVAAQVVSGIGFIGAGTILFLKQGAIRGLTTAAGLWTVAAIGLATGGGLYTAAIATTVIALIILWALQPLEKYYSKRFKHKTLRIVASSHADPNKILEHILHKAELHIHSMTFNRVEDEMILLMQIENPDIEQLDRILSKIKDDTAVREVLWTK
ncbi:MAG: MgtC/SapB family protein [Bacteroidales bacterium]|jgi:putative Mg2+ transporter-C (MgtC) family protein|nr:MgtC/SapB family protein [Bacteroidales bacterium]MCK9449890.1 MgtC/SapB family protein [Bacteroidales bacterium]MDD3701916.1 MgtC/SapB family protein [Bacteroidales bacterium]MDY0370430.1 MgtC/SapB family protein [Bacteroidales bacterium]